jgi:3-hydroxyacyl-CoA dehydrogenase
VVNEGARILEEGIALRASDIDVACILGYNWPGHTGGPMFWADTVGLPKIVAKLEELERTHGPEFTPSALLRKKAAAGESFTR